MKKLLIIFLLISGTMASAQKKLELDGIVKGYEGKVMLILNFVMPNHEVDMENEEMLYMVDGSFRIEKELFEPSLLSIRIRPEITEDFDPRSLESIFIWVDNKNMTLSGEKGNFEYSKVTGYYRQDQNEKSKTYVRELLNDHDRKIESLSHLSSLAAKEELKQLKSISKIYLLNKFRLDHSYLHPNSFVSVYDYSWFVKWIPEMVPKSHAIDFYDRLSDSLKYNTHGAQIKNYIENIAVNQKLKVGDFPYEFSLPDSTGTEISLSSLKGKVVLLDFWASGCGPCRKEHKNYVELYNKYKSKGFEIFSISQDRREKQWLKAMEKDNISWPSVRDETMHITKYTYLVTGIPNNYLINQDGVIIAKDLKGVELQKALGALFVD